MPDCTPQTRSRNSKGRWIPVHGLARSRLYHIYNCMVQRCCNTAAKNYCHYGGRGIRVCDEWARSFSDFASWALSNGYEKTLTIDRKDNNGPYSPENCRWRTLAEQQLNTTRTISVTAFGVKKSVGEWFKDPRCKISYSSLYRRLRHGWTPEQAISTGARMRGD